MTKRLADWLEKMSVALLAIGIFNLHLLTSILGVACLSLCCWLTKRTEEK